jgi:hypothetical protein
MPEPLDHISDAVLYEGHLLYPYRTAALKNQYRYPIGTLYPELFCRAQGAGDASSLQSECVICARSIDAPTLAVRLRFLHVEGDQHSVRDVHVNEPLASLEHSAVLTPFSLAAIAGQLSVSAARVDDEAVVVTTQVRNLSAFGTDDREQALRHALISPHLILSLLDDVGRFASPIDPPDRFRMAVERCRNVGTWPVLAGSPSGGDRQTSHLLLSAPIVLYDFPEIAPESGGDFFDATEIDELLTLRVLTLTDEEKREMAQAGPRARELLQRTEVGGLEQMRALHGALRAPARLSVGARVRLRPKGRADIFDLVLRDRLATVCAVERDLEGRTHLAVTIDDDPGSDLGAFGHRFFFAPDEVELLG